MLHALTKRGFESLTKISTSKFDEKSKNLIFHDAVNARLIYAVNLQKYAISYLSAPELTTV